MNHKIFDYLSRTRDEVLNEVYLLNHFYKILETTLERLSESGNVPQQIFDHLQEIIKGRKNWADAYKLELKLLELMDDEEISLEWHRRLADTGRLNETMRNFYQGQESQQSPEKLRVLVRKLVCDLQWASEVKRVKGIHLYRIRKNVAIIFLASFFMFFLPTILDKLFGASIDNIRFYYVYTAASSGLLGSSFSLLVSVRANIAGYKLDHLRTMSKMGYIIARAAIGAGAGLIMFYLLQSGLLQGPVFPEFILSADQLAKLELEWLNQNVGNKLALPENSIQTKLKLGALAKPTHGVSLLIVWCIIAGLAEKMIPGLLNRKAEKVEPAN